MKFEVCLLFMVTVSVNSRGPHHPHGELPVKQKHHHYRPKNTEPLTGQSEVLHDISHLEEDSNVLTPEKLTQMSPEELEFHYFLAHDFDKNSKLDGLELLKAVYHTVDHDSEGDHKQDNDSAVEENNNLDNFIVLVDRTLESDDTDGDGFLSYAEYKAARKDRELTDRSPIVLAAEIPNKMEWLGFVKSRMFEDFYT